MINLTDTLTISATRLMDLAREVTLQMGDWQFHRDLLVHISNHQIDCPAVFFTLADHADEQARTEFIDAFAAAMDQSVTSHPRSPGGWLLAVSMSDYNQSGVTVSASVMVGGVR